MDGLFTVPFLNLFDIVLGQVLLQLLQGQLSDCLEILLNIVYFLKATRIGRSDKPLPAYKCCGLPIEVEELGLCEHKIELAFLGQGIPLFLEFTQWMIWMLVIYMAIFGVFSISSNVSGNDCINNLDQLKFECDNGIFNMEAFSKAFLLLNTNSTTKVCSDLDDLCVLNNNSKLAFPNKQFQTTNRAVQSILMLILIAVFKIFCVYLRRQQKLTGSECDRGLISPSDFTMMLNQLPPNEYTEEELKSAILKFCQTFDQQHQYVIVKINIAYNITDFIDNQRKIMKLESELKKGIVNEQDYQQSLKYAKEEQAKYKSNFTSTTHVAFVTFQTNENLERILDWTKLTTWEWIYANSLNMVGREHERCFYFKDNLISICKAPEPNDIFWENCGYSRRYKFMKRIMIGFLVFILLAISFGIIFGLQTLQYQKVNNESNIATQTVLSLLISFCVSVINISLYLLITYLVFKEKQSTRTHYDISTTTKIIYAQFINSGLMMLVTNLILYNTTISLTETYRQNIPFERSGGIAQNAFYIMIINALISPIVAILDPIYLYQLFQRRYHSEMTQAQLNTLYQQPSIYMYDVYAYIGKTIWMTFFFAPLVPISLLFSIFALMVYYWIQKYLLLRRYSRPPFESSQLNSEMLEIIEFAPILAAIGQLWIDLVFNMDHSYLYIVDYVSIALALLELVIPTSRLAKMMFNSEEEVFHREKYEDVYLNFDTDYDRSNPITADKAMKQRLDKLQQEQNSNPESFTNVLQQYAMEGGEMHRKIRSIQHKQTTNIQITQPLAQIPGNVQQPAPYQYQQQQYYPQQQNIPQQYQQYANLPPQYPNVPSQYSNIPQQYPNQQPQNQQYQPLYPPAYPPAYPPQYQYNSQQQHPQPHQ